LSRFWRLGRSGEQTARGLCSKKPAALALICIRRFITKKRESRLGVWRSRELQRVSRVRDATRSFLALTNSADSGQKRELAVKPYAQIGSSGPDLDFGVEFFERGAGPFA
jgi:hypothetical protein